MKSYLFRVELEQEEDGRWSAVVPALHGFATWGHSRDEALVAAREMAEAYVDLLLEDGEPIPPADALVSDGISEGPVVTVVAGEESVIGFDGTRQKPKARGGQLRLT